MISIFKIAKGGIKTFFAIDFSQNPTFFFFINGDWVECPDERIDLIAMNSIYGERVATDILKDLEVGESFESLSGNKVSCLATFDNIEEVRQNSKDLWEFLDGYVQMML